MLCKLHCCANVPGSLDKGHLWPLHDDKCLATLSRGESLHLIKSDFPILFEIHFFHWLLPVMRWWWWGGGRSGLRKVETDVSPPSFLFNTPLSLLIVAFLSKQWHYGVFYSSPHICFPCTHPAKIEIHQLFQEKISDRSLWCSDGG